MEILKYLILISLIILIPTSCNRENSPILYNEMDEINSAPKLKLVYPEAAKPGSQFSLSLGINQPDPMYCMSAACIAEWIDCKDIILSSSLTYKILGGPQPEKHQEISSGTIALNSSQLMINIKVPLFSPSQIQNTFYYYKIWLISEEGHLKIHDFKVKVKYKN